MNNQEKIDYKNLMEHIMETYKKQGMKELLKVLASTADKNPAIDEYDKGWNDCVDAAKRIAGFFGVDLDD